MTVSRVAVFENDKWVSAANYVAEYGDGQSVVNNPKHAIAMAQGLSSRFGIEFRAENQVTDAKGGKTWVPAQVTSGSVHSAAAQRVNVRQG